MWLDVHVRNVRRVYTTDIDECLAGAGCGDGALCVNNLGSYDCVPKRGYTRQLNTIAVRGTRIQSSLNTNNQSIEQFAFIYCQFKLCY